MSVDTLMRFERGQRTPHTGNLAAIEEALAKAGVIMLDEDGKGVGISVAPALADAWVPPMPPPAALAKRRADDAARRRAYRTRKRMQQEAST